MALLSTDDPVLEAFAEEVGSTGAVAVEGNRTRWAAGGAPDGEVRLVKAPTGIVDYVPDEMTVTVRAGTSVEELHRALADHRQRTALPERGGTVGGAIVVGENGRAVLGRGRLRDALLQVRYVSDDGRVVTGGGPTVKNVTGFDLPRLMVGSLGTLGLVAELILRTNPAPAVTRWVVSEDAEPFRVPAIVHRPSCILWDGSHTWVEVEGHESAVDAEIDRLGGIGAWTPAEGPPGLPPHRWSLRPADLRTADRFGTSRFVASIGVGTVWSDLPPRPPSVDPVVAALSGRVKAQFDPRGRLNPGRVPGGA